MSKKTYCGFVAIIGKPNVGKSTLLNNLLKVKVSITANKPQTTRHKILGIYNNLPYQILYVDTPGIHRKVTKALNKQLNRSALKTLNEVDLVLFVIDCVDFNDNDEWVKNHLQNINVPLILIVNKIDKLQKREDLLPILQKFNNEKIFDKIIPISALQNEKLKELQRKINLYIPESLYLFPVDAVSDRDDNFMAAEFIREKLTRTLEQELPYALTVVVEALVKDSDLVRISAVIFVDKESHKPIVIGKNGDMLRKIGKLARRELEAYFKKQVYLQLWVKVKSGWSDNEELLHKFGYSD